MKRVVALLLSVMIFAACIPALADSYSDMMEKAEAYLGSGDYTKAIAGYQLAQKLEPQNESAFLGEANIHILLEDYSAAAGVIRTALEFNPVSPDVWRLKCLIDVRVCDPSALEQDLIYAEVCEADLSDVYLPAASMYLNAGSYEEAVSCFRLCDFSSLDPEQREMFRKALIRSGKSEEAERLGLAAVPVRNAELDSAFESGRLTLVPASFPLIEAENFEFPDEIWEATDTEKPEDPAAMIASVLPDTKYDWISLSPAGNSGILAVEQGNGIGYYNGKYRIIYPSLTRGTEDTYGNLHRVFSMSLYQLLSDAGVVYSPDGRYAAIFNSNYVLIQAKLYLDPIIIDLSTGEMILTATYPGKLTQENIGAVTTAAFSADGGFLYYMMYGKMDTASYHTALYRYDLRTQQTELCYSGSDLHYYPRLSETGDGAFLIIRDVLKSDQPQGITRISCENSVWTGEDHLFDLPGTYWRTNRLLSSENSGYAVLFGKNAVTDAYYSFQMVLPDEALQGINQYYALSKDNHEVLSFSAGDITSLFDPLLTGRSDTSEPLLDLPFQTILASALSPDGHYLMVLGMSGGMSTSGAVHLDLIRLDDLSVREVTGLDPRDIQFGTGSNYAPVIEWNTDTLIIGTADGTRAYRFQ